MKISFNLRLRYEECEDCIKFIESIGGNGYITVGGSYYVGEKETIQELINYMSEKGYDLASMAIDESPMESTEKRINELKKSGVIKL